MKRHVFHSGADEEYTEAALYYRGVNLELGGRFFDEIESLISDIRSDPLRFRIFDPPFRRHVSQIFPYAVVYVDQPDRIWIIAVMHLKRRPGYWKRRVG